MGLLVGIGQITHRLVIEGMLCAEREGFRIFVAGLQFHLGKVNAAAVHSGGCTGLKAAQGQTQFSQIICKANGCMHAVGACGLNRLTGDNRAVQIRAAGNNDRFGVIPGAQLGDHTGDLTTFYGDLHDLRLLQFQILLQFQHMLHVLLVLAAITLGTKRMHSRAFALVQHPVLDAGRIRSHTHLATQSVQFPNQMALAGATDGGIAGHIAHRIQIDGKEDGLMTKPCTGQRRFDACMTGTDHRHFAASCVICGHSSVSSVFFSSLGSSKGLHTTSQRLMGVPRPWNFSS